MRWKNPCPSSNCRKSRLSSSENPIPRKRMAPAYEPAEKGGSSVSGFRGRAAENGGLVGIGPETGSERLGLEFDAQFRVPPVRQIFADMFERADRCGEKLPWVALVAIQINLFLGQFS